MHYAKSNSIRLSMDSVLRLQGAVGSACQLQCRASCPANVGAQLVEGLWGQIEGTNLDGSGPEHHVMS